MVRRAGAGPPGQLLFQRVTEAVAAGYADVTGITPLLRQLLDTRSAAFHIRRPVISDRTPFWHF